MPDVTESFVIPFPRAHVWRELHDFEMVAGAMPGVALDGAPEGEHLKGSLGLRLGPISTHFAGEAEISMDDATNSGVVRGQALDRKNNSRARSEIRFSLAEEGPATRVDVAVGFTLSGALAQFSRGGIVQELAQRLTREFARNLETAMAARLALDHPLGLAQAAPTDASGDAAPPAPHEARPIGLFGLIWPAFLAWLRRKFGSPAGGKDMVL
ncbi:MAG: SRPBCC family protein [Acetobacteraceae bacterium]